jgi:hypothetical protein
MAEAHIAPSTESWLAMSTSRTIRRTAVILAVFLLGLLSACSATSPTPIAPTTTQAEALTPYTAFGTITLHLTNCSEAREVKKDVVYVSINKTCAPRSQSWPDIVLYGYTGQLESLQCKHDPQSTRILQPIEQAPRRVGGIVASYSEARLCRDDAASELHQTWTMPEKGVTIVATQTPSMNVDGLIEAATWSR